MMGVPRIPHRLCAICVSAPAAVPRLLDGERLIRVCVECGSDPGDDRPIKGRTDIGRERDRALAMIAATPGVTAEDLVSSLPRRIRPAFFSAIRRLALSGEIQRIRVARRQGGRSGLTYALFPAGTVVTDVDDLGVFQRRAADAVRANPGLSAAQLAALLELDRQGHNNLTCALTRLSLRGVMRREMLPSDSKRGAAYRYWIAEVAKPVCACGAAIVRGGERGPSPTMCRVCRKAIDDQKRRDANRKEAA